MQHPAIKECQVKYKNTIGSIIQLILHRASSQLVALSVGLLAGLTFPTLGIIRVKTFEGLNFQWSLNQIFKSKIVEWWRNLLQFRLKVFFLQNLKFVVNKKSWMSRGMFRGFGFASNKHQHETKKRQTSIFPFCLDFFFLKPRRNEISFALNLLTRAFLKQKWTMLGGRQCFFKIKTFLYSVHSLLGFIRLKHSIRFYPLRKVV